MKQQNSLDMIIKDFYETAKKELAEEKVKEAPRKRGEGPYEKNGKRT